MKMVQLTEDRKNRLGLKGSGVPRWGGGCHFVLGGQVGLAAKVTAEETHEEGEGLRHVVPWARAFQVEGITSVRPVAGTSWLVMGAAGGQRGWNVGEIRRWWGLDEGSQITQDS